MTSFGPDFTDFLVALSDHEVEFLLIGGWALAAHGHVRGTDALDVFVHATPENAPCVMNALLEFGAPLGAHGVESSGFASLGLGYRMGVKPNLIEVLTTIDGVTFEEAARDARTIDVEGRRVRVIGRAALLKNKRASGRLKDLADVEWLERHEE